MSFVSKIYIWQRVTALLRGTMNLYEFFNDKNRASALKSKYENMCIQSGMKFKVFGKDSKNNDIFYCYTNGNQDKPKIALLSGLHGNEPAGPHAILDYLLSGKTNDEINLFVMPLLNPHGFNRFIRKDGNNTDMNRQWNESSRKLIRRLKKLFLMKKFDMVISLHEDPSVDGFYVYGGRYIKGKNLKSIADIIRNYMKPIKDGEIYGDPVYDGVVEDNNEEKPKHKKSLEFFFDRNNIPNITVEISGKGDLEDRIEIYRKFLEELLKTL